MLNINSVYLGDCLDIMKGIDNKSINMILCDLPYGTTSCKWDVIIPFDLLWEHYKRIITDNGVIILTGSQPFTSLLVMSNLEWFKYEIIWEKDKPSNFSYAKHGIMKYHENVLIFSKNSGTYNPQMYRGVPNHSVGKGIRKKANESGANTAVVTNILDGKKYPKSVLKFNRESKPIHPTQKPLELFEWLIRTYSNEGEIVLDNCAGSGTTGEACISTNRNFILIEKEENYYNMIKERLNG